ncbi:MAG: fibronectin type III domain-containing protein, partial [Thermoplasmata archaeon]|nr:fibronectin type III domain-containing protein [Thermoplasmata archaeon]
GMVGLQWGEPEVTWNLSIRGYRVYRGTTEDNLELLVTLPGFSSYTDTSVTNGQTYYYAVTAFNVHGESNLTDVIEATPIGSPSSELNFRAYPGCSSIRFSWIIPSNSTRDPLIGFRIYKGTDLVPMPLLVELGMEADYVDEDVVNGVTYYYKIHAFTSNFTGHNTSAKSVMPVGPPTQPQGLRARWEDAEVTLRWNTPESDGGRPLLGYKLLRGDSETNLSSLVDDIEPLEMKYIDEGLENGVTYYYALIAFNDRGDGPRTTSIINGTPYGPPSAPVIPKAVENNGSIYIHWGRSVDDGGDPEILYIVYCQYPNGTYVDGIPTFNTSYIWTNLENGINYSFKIHAVTRGGFSPWSNVVSATPWTLPDPPRIPEVVAGNRFLEIRWTLPDNDGGLPIVEFLIYRGETPGSLEPYVRANYPATSYIDMDV